MDACEHDVTPVTLNTGSYSAANPTAKPEAFWKLQQVRGSWSANSLFDQIRHYRNKLSKKCAADVYPPWTKRIWYLVSNGLID